MIADLHCHTEYSFDCDVPAETMVAAAVAAGVDLLAITDHFEIDRLKSEDGYKLMIRESVDFVKRQPRRCIKLLCGIEIGQGNLDIELANAAARSEDFDVVLASLHSLDYLASEEVPFGDMYYLKFADMADSEVYGILREYYRTLLVIAERTDYDVLTHLTYPSRYYFKETGKYTDMSRLKDVILPVLETVARRGKCLEVNTNEVGKKYGLLVPQEEILAWYRDAGGKYVSAGADAHKGGDVGNGITAAYDALRGLGFTSISTYEKRVRREWII